LISVQNGQKSALFAVENVFAAAEPA